MSDKHEDDPADLETWRKRFEELGSKPLNYVLDGDGQPVAEPDVIVWARWLFEHAHTDGTRIIGHHHFNQKGKRILVSTVFLGFDYGWGVGPPVLWETMIFGGPHDQRQWRYTSRDEAEAGHTRACQIATGAVKDDDADLDSL